jgi:hypothetical protein
MFSQGGADPDSDDDIPTLFEDDSSGDDEPLPKRRSQTMHNQGNLPIRTSHFWFPVYLEPRLVRNTRINSAAARRHNATAERRRDWKYSGSHPDDSTREGESSGSNPDDSKQEGDSKKSSEDKSDSDKDDDDVQSIFMTTAAASIFAKEPTFLDSCASRELLIVRNSNVIDDIDSTVGVINLTKRRDHQGSV